MSRTHAGSLVPHLGQSSAISAGVVWAGNPAVTDTIDALEPPPEAGSRYSNRSKPLAMYRGSKDSTMTPWAQEYVQRRWNQSGVQCDLFTAPNATHRWVRPPCPSVRVRNNMNKQNSKTQPTSLRFFLSNMYSS
jgi:hypothetical protein